MERGTVKWFNDEKGYGFIQPAGGGKDLFVHWKCIVSENPGRKSLAEGQSVEFDSVDTGKGPQAQNVRAVA